MIPFKPDDPFPLLTSGSYTYRDAQDHSRRVDEWLGLQTDFIESKISIRFQKRIQDQQLWVDLPVQTLQTPYVEIREMLSNFDMPRGTKLIDLGCGYARIGFVLARHFPEVDFIGYEFIGERVDAAKAAALAFTSKSMQIVECDLSEPSFKPAAGQIYFLYDYGSKAAITKTLNDLKAIAQTQPITVVGRGRLSRDSIELEQPWLSQVIAPVHSDHFSIYRSSESSL